MRKNKVMLWMALSVLGILSSSTIAIAKNQLQRGVKIMHLDEKKIATIRVNPNGMVLSFPVAPKKVILGKQNAFDVQYVDHDVAVAALTPNAKSNMFVYLLGRRYSFRLFTVPKGGDEIILVRDVSELKMRSKRK
jgi:hypothetical protein